MNWRRTLPACGGSLVMAAAVLPARAVPQTLLAQAWTVAGQRSAATVDWLEDCYGDPGMFGRFPTVGDLSSGRWSLTSNTGRWETGFWPGTLWLLAQHSGDEAWNSRAIAWSAPLATSSNSDHDIGFITLASLGKGWLCHDEFNDPGGGYRAFAAAAIVRAAGLLDRRFDKPNGQGEPVPAGFIRSWNHPYYSPYPVCIDNLVNLEVMLSGYELNGRRPEDRGWFDHALAHARTSIARHLRADGSTYHVVRHFESGPAIGTIERKNTGQGYGDETTWSRGQAWALYGFSMIHRYARRDPGTEPADILAAAQAAADYFIDHLPANLTGDPWNHRTGDFVPPSDFNAALGEPDGPWNDANNDYDPADGSGLGDRQPALESFTPRDSAAAAIAASGLLDLAGQTADPADSARYLTAAEAIIECIISYDGDGDNEPDTLCEIAEAAHPGILKAGTKSFGDQSRSLSYGDYYFLEALARLEAVRGRELLHKTWRAAEAGFGCEFERHEPAPAMMWRVQRSAGLAGADWVTVAAKTGVAPWTGSAGVIEEPAGEGKRRVRIVDPTPAETGFFRVLTLSAGGL